jgi:hypothetical protein
MPLLARSLFQFDGFTDPALAAWTLKGTSSKARLVWLDASKPQRRTAFGANRAHSSCAISEGFNIGPLNH